MRNAVLQVCLRAWQLLTTESNVELVAETCTKKNVNFEGRVWKAFRAQTKPQKHKVPLEIAE